MEFHKCSIAGVVYGDGDDNNNNESTNKSEEEDMDVVDNNFELQVLEVSVVFVYNTTNNH